MPLPFTTRIKNAWNAFLDNRENYRVYDGLSSSSRPDRLRSNRGMERTIIASIYNRIATDVSSIDIRHVYLDKDGRFEEEANSKLNNCLKVEANIDQTGRAMIHDAVSSMLDEGCVAIIPTDLTENPRLSNSWDVLEMRVGRVVEWKPRDVKVDVYNEENGKHQEIVLPKGQVAIVENPFYSVMNEQNSTLQRLVRKLNILDRIDDKIGSNKLDLIIQLPYSVKSPLKVKQASTRIEEIRRQLEGSEYGIAYVDSMEKITQLNRPIENTLLGQIEYLTNQAYAQLGLSQAILDGSVDEKTMLNYQNRILEPILTALTEEMTRKFLTPTARTQGQAIRFFTNPFRLVPMAQLAELVDKLTRNEIATSNEMRQIIGWKPSKDPSADELRNKNLSAPKGDENGGGMSDEKAKAMIERIEERGD